MVLFLFSRCLGCGKTASILHVIVIPNVLPSGFSMIFGFWIFHAKNAQWIDYTMQDFQGKKEQKQKHAGRIEEGLQIFVRLKK